MRRSPTIYAALGVVVAAIGLFAAVAFSLGPASPVIFYQGDSGVLQLDGGGPWFSQPYTARIYSTGHQTPVCTALAAGAPGGTINATMTVLGSNDQVNWVTLGSPVVMAIDAGFVLAANAAADLQSGYPFEEVEIISQGSDAGVVTCTVTVF